MATFGIRIGVLTLALAAALAAPPVSRAIAAGESDIEAKIAAAKTPADHDAIAAYYEQQAADARTKIDEHKKMAADYKKMPHNSKVHFDQHCAALSRDYASAAKEYDALAKAHHQMAKQAK